MSEYNNIYKKLTRPNFEINFYLKHFCGYDDETCRSYESFLMQPITDSMYFADNAEYYDEEYIDCIDLIDPLINEKYIKKDIEGHEIELIKPSNDVPNYNEYEEDDS